MDRHHTYGAPYSKSSEEASHHVSLAFRHPLASLQDRIGMGVTALGEPFAAMGLEADAGKDGREY